MTTSVLLGPILTAGALLEAAVGLGLIVIPSRLATLLLGAPLEGTGLAVARLGGGALLAVGIACWAARRTPSTAAGLGVSRAFLAYNLVACAVLVDARPPLPGGVAALGAAIAHALLAAGLLWPSSDGSPLIEMASDPVGSVTNSPHFETVSSWKALDP